GGQSQGNVARRTFCQPAREEALRAALAQGRTLPRRGASSRWWSSRQARQCGTGALRPHARRYRGSTRSNCRWSSTRSTRPGAVARLHIRDLRESAPAGRASRSPGRRTRRRGGRLRRDEGLRRLEADRATVPLALLHASGTGVPEHGWGGRLKDVDPTAAAELDAGRKPGRLLSLAREALQTSGAFDP